MHYKIESGDYFRYTDGIYENLLISAKQAYKFHYGNNIFWGYRYEKDKVAYHQKCVKSKILYSPLILIIGNINAL